MFYFIDLLCVYMCVLPQNKEIEKKATTLVCKVVVLLPPCAYFFTLRGLCSRLDAVGQITPLHVPVSVGFTRHHRARATAAPGDGVKEGSREDRHGSHWRKNKQNSRHLSRHVGPLLRYLFSICFLTNCNRPVATLQQEQACS